VDSGHYKDEEGKPWSGDLTSCEADALDMAEIAKAKGFTITTILTKQATNSRVIKKIEKAAKELEAGDIFMISYSGHGGQVPDQNGDEIDLDDILADETDETWCLYDGELIDDTLYSLWGKFKDGVRILVFSDSCHSGTITKMANFESKLNMTKTNEDKDGNKYRFLPTSVAQKTYRNNKVHYDNIMNNIDSKDARGENVKASVILFSGCQDNQLSLDGSFNGYFTGQLKKVWQNGNFKKSYKKFYKAIVNGLPPNVVAMKENQTPNYFKVGKPNIQFEHQLPFTI